MLASLKSLIVMLAMTAAVSATAQTSKPTQPPQTADRRPVDDSVMSAALALFEGPEIEKQLTGVMLQAVNTSLNAQFEKMRADGLEIPVALTDRIGKVALEEVRAMADAMLPNFRTQSALVYARYFTAEELRELKRIQDLPVSRKLQSTLPAMTPDLVKIGLDVAMERQPELQRKLMEELNDWLAERPASQKTS